MLSLGNSGWPIGIETVELLPPTAKHRGKEYSQRQGGLPHDLTPSLLVPEGSHQQLRFKKGMVIASLNIKVPEVT